jgi:hypothetical protein
MWGEKIFVLTMLGLASATAGARPPDVSLARTTEAVVERARNGLFTRAYPGTAATVRGRDNVTYSQEEKEHG